MKLKTEMAGHAEAIEELHRLLNESATHNHGAEYYLLGYLGNMLTPRQLREAAAGLRALIDRNKERRERVINGVEQ